MNIAKDKKLNTKIIGYARVSTFEQCLDLQTNALKQYGCNPIFKDIGVSGGLAPNERKQFQQAVLGLKAGDIFAVWKLDRLGRTLSSIIETIDCLAQDGIQFVSLTENIDTTSAAGRAFWQFIGLMAELERGLIRERTIEGMKAAKARGVSIGRPRKLSDETIQIARLQVRQGTSSLNDIAKHLDVSTSTLRRALSRNLSP